MDDWRRGSGSLIRGPEARRHPRLSAVSKPDPDAGARHGVRVLFFWSTSRHAGDLTGNVGVVLPLADERVAHEMLQGSRSKPGGKMVASVGE
jgi:hypothetical protein